jgi:hypothetical protein
MIEYYGCFVVVVDGEFFQILMFDPWGYCYIEMLLNHDYNDKEKMMKKIEMNLTD